GEFAESVARRSSRNRPGVFGILYHLLDATEHVQDRQRIGSSEITDGEHQDDTSNTKAGAPHWPHAAPIFDVFAFPLVFPAHDAPRDGVRSIMEPHEGLMDQADCSGQDSMLHPLNWKPPTSQVPINP